MASVVLKPGESQQNLLRRFRKKVNRAGILSAARKKRYFISKSEKRRIVKRKAMRRERRRRAQTRSGRREF